MTSKLRILIDEAVPDPLARALMNLRAVKAVYVRDMPQLIHKKDNEVLDYAIRDRRIVVTTETSFQAFGVCTHPGIIIFSVRDRHEAIRQRAFQKFLLSGHRRRANDCLTYLKQNEATIRGHEGESTYRY